MSNIVSKNFAFSTPFLRGFRMLKIPLVNDDGMSAWPEIFPMSRIEELRSTVGPRHFSAQMMLDFSPPDRARLDPDALRFYESAFDMRTARIDDVQITGVCAYWDPSSGRRGRDGSVCVVLYRDDRARHIFIHDVRYLIVDENELHPLGRQCEMVLELLKQYDLHRVTIETNGIGNALPEIMRDVATRRGARITINSVINTRNKETRILDAIEPVLTTGRLHAHQRITQTPLLSEMLGWSPLGGVGHDDGLDALAGAICDAPTPVRPMGGVMRTFSANTNFKL